jgi:serine phosphatase RsbU (regulator of sigma subunit)
MGSGTYFGEVALIGDHPRSANVVTGQASHILRLRKTTFDALLDTNQEFAINFYKNCLGETIARMQETASNLTVSQNVLNQKTIRLDRIDADLSDAKAIQDYFLTSEQLHHERLLAQGIRQSYIYRPFVEVGGDFLNVTSVGEQKFGIIIADVMGHGISAAMATGVLRSAFTIFSKEDGDKPARLMERLNEHIHEIFPSLFATSYYAVVDKALSEVYLTKAGHMHPLIWKESQKSFRKIEPPGPGLGILPKVQYKDVKVSVEPGDKILFFTDGITEQKNDGGEMYGQQRLEMSFSHCIHSGERHIVQELFQDLERYRGSREFMDDVTLMLLEFDE